MRSNVFPYKIMILFNDHFAPILPIVWVTKSNQIELQTNETCKTAGAQSWCRRPGEKEWL